MVNFETIAKERLAASAELTALVEDRIYHEVAPQGCAKPYVVHQVVSDVPVNSTDGYSDLTTARVQVDCYAKTGLQAKAVADEVNEVLGAVVEVGFSSYRADRRGGYEDETELHRVSMDFLMTSCGG